MANKPSQSFSAVIIEAAQYTHLFSLGLAFKYTPGEESFVPNTLGGITQILTREDFYELVAYCERFYAKHTDEEINAINASQLSKYRDEDSKQGYVYLLRRPDGAHKIGMTIDLDTRVKAIAGILKQPIEVIHTIPCQDHAETEKRLHKLFRAKKLKGVVNREWFNLDPDDVAWIKSLETDGDL